MIKTVTDKELEWINEYETRRENERGKQDGIIGEIVESFKPLIEANLEYLKYAQLKGWMKISEKEKPYVAQHNALISVIGRAINWAINDARELAFQILEEVNDHKMAEKVSPVLEGKMVIFISVNALREELQGRLEREATPDEMKEFIGCVERDIPQFIVDNAKYFIRECLPKT